MTLFPWKLRPLSTAVRALWQLLIALLSCSRALPFAFRTSMREFMFKLSITPRAPYARALPFGVPNNDTGLEMQTLNHSYAHTLVLCPSHSETNTWYIGIQQTPPSCSTPSCSVPLCSITPCSIPSCSALCMSNKYTGISFNTRRIPSCSIPLVLWCLFSETKILEFNKRFYGECRREAQMNYQAKTGNGPTGAPPAASTHQVVDHNLYF